MNIPALYILIIVFGAINLFRMAFFLIASDVYNLQQFFQDKRRKRLSYPYFSVIIPAHNEESHIIKAIESVFLNNYKHSRLQVIVVDNNSTDKTAKIVRQYIKSNPDKNLKLMIQKTGGKANALNSAIRKFANGKLIMCLDADSTIEKNALANAAMYFRDKTIAGLAANVKIQKRPGILNLIQQYEYLICYQMKRAESLFNIEYIVGGIGSVFRKSILDKIGHYDTNTVTEDIDLTMKILSLGNKKFKVIYGSNVVAYTEAVISIKGLLAQRHRWKWGRCQTFLKNTHLFFSKNKDHSLGLTHFYLPFAIYGDIAYFFEPILLFYILTNSVIYHDIYTILSAWLVISIYTAFNILSENTINVNEKIGYLIFTPTMYILFYILSFVEYVALIKSLFSIHKLKRSISQADSNWIHVERPKVEIIVD